MKNEGRRRMECPSLPPGWIREEVPRAGGLSAGKCDVYYYPPGGRTKCRSKPEMIKFLGDSVDLSGFDYGSGTFHSSIIKPKGGVKTKPKTDLMKGVKNGQNVNSLVPPIRQTASIFKQPVTVVKVIRNCMIQANKKQINIRISIQTNCLQKR